MINYFLPLVIFLIPAIGMVSGLSLATTIPLFLIITFIFFKNNLPYQIILQKYRLELFFLIWCFLCCFWSLKPIAGLVIYLRVGCVLLLYLLVKDNEQRLESTKPFILGLAAAIILFFIEYYTQGILSRNFRTFFYFKNDSIFYLYMLDRGCSLLALISWIMIGILIRDAKYLLSFIFYLFIAYLLHLSDSLASFLGFILGGITFLISKLFYTKTLQIIFFRLINTGVVLVSLLMPVMVYNIKPLELVTESLQNIPDSAKHRLFIWNFVANKILEKPILGHGFSASRNVIISDEEIIEYKEYRWSPLPLHPHNNILQILFETGLVGLITFLSLVCKYLNQINKANEKNSYRSLSYACFINYYIIGMISFSVWQLWWVCSGVWTAIMIKKYISNQ